MKAVLVCCALFAVIAISQSAEKPDYYKHHSQLEKAAGESDKWVPLKKQKQNCRMVCDEDILDVPAKNVTRYPDGSWSYQLQTNTDQFLHIAFNSTMNFLVVFNPQLNITWISNGIYIGIFNITTNALFLIDTTKNMASIFTNVSHLLIQSNINMMLTFSGLIDTVLAKSIDMTTNFVFKVDAFLQAIQHQTLTVFFRGYTNILNAFQLNFSFYISASIQINGFNTFLAPIVGVGTVSTKIFGFLTGSINYGMQFTLQTVGMIFVGIGKINLEIQTIINNSIKSVLDLGQNSWNVMLNMGGSFWNLITSSLNIVGSGKIGFSMGGNAKVGFLINFGNDTGHFSINYNSSQNFIAILNQKLRFALIANGNTGSYFLVNLTSGIGMVVKHEGYARVITDVDTVHRAFDADLKIDLSARLSILADIFRDSEDFNTDNENTFSFKNYLQYLINVESSDSLFIDRAELESVINNSFGKILEIATSMKSSHELFISFGNSIMFNAILDGNVIGSNFAQLFNKLYVEREGKFDASIMEKVHADFKASIAAGSKAFSSFIFGNVLKACFSVGGVVGSLFGHFGIGNNC